MAGNKRLPAKEYLDSLFIYDKGDLIWRHRPPSHFKKGKHKTPEQKANVWNARWAGTQAGCPDKDGYTIIRFDGGGFRKARVVWKMFNGTCPEDTIDHINRVRNDDRIENLREATMLEQSRNIYRGDKHEHSTRDTH